jgi:hypothetical protein
MTDLTIVGREPPLQSALPWDIQPVEDLGVLWRSIKLNLGGVKPPSLHKSQPQCLGFVNEQWGECSIKPELP